MIALETYVSNLADLIIDYASARLGDEPFSTSPTEGAMQWLIQNLPPGPHRVTLELNDANHHALDKRVVEFVVPDLGQQQHTMTHAGTR